MTPTPEQEAILQATRERNESILVRAYAGTGKTTTLEMIAKALPEKPSLAVAFNKKIAQELERRFPSHFQVKTLNGLGHVAFGKSIGRRCVVDEKKLGRLVTAELKKNDIYDNTTWDAVRQLVSAAMTAGLVPSIFPVTGLVPDNDESWADLCDPDTEDQILQLARSVLIASIKECFGPNGANAILSYDDQIYMSALFNGDFPRFPIVLVDEAQDLSPLNHIQVKKCAAGRIIICGDELQSIYAFRGADHESIAKLRALRQDWIELPLATTFRCPKVVVDRQQKHAPGYKAFATAPDGEIITVPLVNGSFKGGNPKDQSNYDTPETWDWSHITQVATGRIAVLCRNNAPLLSIAFKLIRQGIGVTMLGRDIGKGLETLSRKIIPNDNEPTKRCIELVQDWMITQMTIAEARGQDNKLEGIEDRAACLLAVLESDVRNARELRQKLQTIFSSTGTVTLSTIHKAKGLEWDTVVHLDPWRIPSRYARSQAERQQEANMRYVCETRSKHTLILADLRDFVNGD